MIGKVENHFIAPTPNLIFDGVSFNTWAQKENEIVDSFVTALNGLSERCGYGGLQDELICVLPSTDCQSAVDMVDSKMNLSVSSGSWDNKLLEKLQLAQTCPWRSYRPAQTEWDSQETEPAEKQLLGGDCKCWCHPLSEEALQKGKPNNKPDDGRAMPLLQKDKKNYWCNKRLSTNQCGICGKEPHSCTQCPAKDSRCSSYHWIGHWWTVRQPNIVSVITKKEAFLGDIASVDLPWMTTLMLWGIGFAVPEQIRKSDTGQNTAQRATSDTMLMSQMHSPWCNCHRIGSALLTFWRNGAEPL